VIYNLLTFSRRFPIVSGLRVEWDSRRPKGERVLSVTLIEGSQETSQNGDQKEAEVKESSISREGGRLYNIVTRLYMAQGFDGYEAFKDCKFLVDEENGRIMSDLVRHFLLGKDHD
jgi:5'-nucleotidase